MATDYKLTWRAEQGGRWRKRYKGVDHYFPRKPGESKEASYRRCFAEWMEKKAEVDGREREADPSRRALTVLIARTKARLLALQQEDTPDNRRQWSHWRDILASYQEHLDAGIDIWPADPENPPDFLHPVSIYGPSADPPAPWEATEQPSDPRETIDSHIRRFLQRKERQVEKGERSSGRVEVLRVGLNAFALSCGGDRPIAAVTSSVLRQFRDELERLVDNGTLRPHSARDRLQAAKQFVRWAWEVEAIDCLPRVLESRDFSIRVPSHKVETFTDDEIARLLGAASESTRLYLLLMLNCGMTQQDLSDLRQGEVDWEEGRVTRKRSKTRKASNGKNAAVPEVSYKLWPETFRLLSAYRSDHATLALTNAKGGPLKVETLVNGRAKKVDNVRSAYNRLIAKLANDKRDPLRIDKPLKLLRKTAATKLGSHPEYARFAQHFLGHAPATVADKFYVAPSQEQFDAAVEWLATLAD